ncbi:MAG: FHA domain-containing protein [Planctomycetes bacterium]|nr:FHA domain-containing protein [Planctomycetota bacterium]
MSPAGPGPCLYLTRGADRSILCLEGPIAILGSAPDCDLVVGADGVSRHHAVVRRGKGGYVLHDFASKRGTFVNGRRVEEHALADGDVIRLGSASLVYAIPTMVDGSL